MKTTVIITFRMEGMHRWPEAKDVFPDVGFLSDPHRHMFHFKMSKLVEHNDRDVEFIRWKRKVQKWLWKEFRDGSDMHLNFERMSCEDIATVLLTKFKCEYVEVFEDGENGARVEK